MGKKFFVIVEGVETGAQRCLVQMIRDIGQTRVSSAEECDYFLVFCPIVSRVAANISGALARVPANKPVILVVLHHTSDANLALAESSRQVHDLKVVLTVDFLFWNDDLLDSNCNDKSWNLIQSRLRRPKTSVENLKKPLVIAAILGVAAVIAIVVAVIVVFTRKKHP